MGGITDNQTDSALVPASVEKIYMADLEIAEIFHESGTIKFRYARYLAADGSR